MASDKATRLPSKKTGSGRHPQSVRSHDLYPTPAPLTEALLRVEPLPNRIWEPAAGMGHMSSVLKAAGHKVFSSDLMAYGTDGVFIQDFFEFKSAPAGSGCIVTNPPFSVAGDFVRHGLTLCPKVAVLGRLAFLESSSRVDILDTHLARVFSFINRPGMMHRWSDRGDGVYEEWQGKKSSSAMAFAWFVFERDHDARQNGTQLRRIWHSKPEIGTKAPKVALNEPLVPSREDGKLVLT